MDSRHHRYTCPLCKSTLSHEKYEHVLNIDQARRDEIQHLNANIAKQRAVIREERRTIAAEEAAKSRKNEARLRTQIDNLSAQVRQTKTALAQKEKLGAQEKKRIERRAAEQAEARVSRQLRRSDEERARSEERRRRDNEAWRTKIEELQRRVDAKDRSHFGPEGEDELEKLLRRQFPLDDIQRRGRVGDIIHTVIENNEPCATIVYECKRTTTWQAEYLRQLKRAMEAHGTRHGVLVTRALPRGQSGLCVKDGIIVAIPALAHHLVAILREMLVELSRVRLSEKGKEDKTAEIYRYLRSDEFRNSLQSINSRTKELRDSLEREKSSHEGWWTRREQHYAAITRQTAGVTARVSEIIAAAPKRHLAQVHRIGA